MAPLASKSIDRTREGTGAKEVEMNPKGFLRAAVCGAVVACLVGSAATPVHADPGGVLVSVCGETGMCAPVPDPVAAAAIVTLAVFQKNIDQNLRAAANESGVGAQVLRGLTGISAEDIGRRGLLG